MKTLECQFSVSLYCIQKNIRAIYLAEEIAKIVVFFLVQEINLSFSDITLYIITSRDLIEMCNFFLNKCQSDS